jgi:hypothetical protein
MNLRLVGVCLLSLCVLCTSCNKTPRDTSVNVDVSTEENTPIEINETSEVVLEEIHSTSGGFYEAAFNDQRMVLEEFVFHKTLPQAQSVSSTQTIQNYIRCYQYDDSTIKALDDTQQPPSGDWLFLYYVNQSNEIYYWNKMDSLTLKTPAHDFEELSTTFGSLIPTTRYNNTILPWVLFDNTEVVSGEYILYNLEDHSHYSISFDHSVTSFWAFEGLLVFGYETAQMPGQIRYKGSFFEIQKPTDDDFGRMTFPTPTTRKRLGHGDENKVLFSVIVSSNPDIESRLVYYHSFEFPSIPSGTFFISYYPEINQLLWSPTTRDQIFSTDCSNGNTEEESFSEEIFSRIIPFETATNKGFWAIPALTTIGMADHVYCYVLVEGGLLASLATIGKHWFEDAVFVNKDTGSLYIISYDGTSETSKHALLRIQPSPIENMSIEKAVNASTEKESFLPVLNFTDNDGLLNIHGTIKRSSVKFSGSFLQNSQGPISFYLLSSLPDQMILATRKYPQPQDIGTMQSALFRLQYQD